MRDDAQRPHQHNTVTSNSGDNFNKSNLTDKDKDALKILGLKSDTNWSDIQKKFKTLVKKYHPDKNRGSKKYEDILKKITLAYSQLKVSMRK